MGRWCTRELLRRVCGVVLLRITQQIVATQNQVVIFNSTTHRLQSAGQLLGIPVLDHIIIGDNRYVSLRERGLCEEY